MKTRIHPTLRAVRDRVDIYHGDGLICKDVYEQDLIFLGFIEVKEEPSDTDKEYITCYGDECPGCIHCDNNEKGESDTDYGRIEKAYNMYQESVSENARADDKNYIPNNDKTFFKEAILSHLPPR